MKKTYIWAVLAVLLWSTAFAGVKIGLSYASPLFFAGTRFMLAGIMVIPFTGKIRGYWTHARKNWKTVLSVALSQTAIMYALYFNGVDRVPAAIAAIVMGAEPLVMAVTAHVLIHDDKLSRRKVVSLLMGIGGVILISLDRNFGDATGLRELSGIILLLLASISGSLSQVIVKKRTENPLYLNSQQIFLGGFMLFIASLISSEPIPKQLPPEFFAAIIWLSFVSAFAFSIWYTLLHRPGVKVSELNMLKFLIPLSGAMLGWLIFPDDSPNLISIIGMLVISLSVILFYKRKPIVSDDLKDS